MRGRQRHPNEDTDTYTQIPKKRIQKKRERRQRVSVLSWIREMDIRGEYRVMINL